jgi:hypothetical protein
MNTLRFKLFLTVIATACWLNSNGCSSTQRVLTSAPARQDATSTEGQAPEPSVEMLRDGETFTAFCDRA